MLQTCLNMQLKLKKKITFKKWLMHQHNIDSNPYYIFTLHINY